MRLTVLLLVALAICSAGCGPAAAQLAFSAVAPTSPSALPTSTPVPEATSSPSVTPSAGVGARDVLDQFMVTVVQRQDPVTLGLLSAHLRRELEADSKLAARLELYQVSNPCWYRYEVLSFQQPTRAIAVARVQVYQHFWGGDVMGGPPRSWEQEVTLVETPPGWRVDRLAEPQSRREERGEPHGETISACRQARPMQLLPTPPPTPAPELTAEADAERTEITRRLFGGMTIPAGRLEER